MVGRIQGFFGDGGNGSDHKNKGRRKYTDIALVTKETYEIEKTIGGAVFWITIGHERAVKCTKKKKGSSRVALSQERVGGERLKEKLSSMNTKEFAAKGERDKALTIPKGGHEDTTMEKVDKDFGTRTGQGTFEGSKTVAEESQKKHTAANEKKINTGKGKKTPHSKKNKKTKTHPTKKK